MELISSLLIICLSVFCLLPDYEYDQSVLEVNPIIRSQAKYVDELLDHYDVDRYQYLGFNGNRFYGHTKHSPLGPIFIQDHNNFKEDGTWFTDNLLRQMEQAKILIVQKIDVPVLNDKLYEIINEDFTLEPWDRGYSPGIPEAFDYTVYYRTREDAHEN